MKRSTRNDLAAAIGALCPATFATFLWLFFRYFASRPRERHPELGLTYPLNNHGSYAYLSSSESTGLALLMVTFFVGLLLAIIVVPKDFIVRPPGTPRWVAHLGAAFRTDLANPSRRLTAIFLCSFALYCAAIFFAGRWVVDFVVARGIAFHL